ncbi:hypothetical protein DAPPUDRAFT_316283 [Daphnia pulex]|uniref:BTB domain-containing protein n=1 Tax=Daphnia pulex TaxID=6669 RepID=E9GCF0_DAPPU|nr:hypothetical protein DAPPUDRAFT_316283 [Daphnia pulex]|eukprot:EFX82540.1 hypothetical protein DAPPUDRAFT_316283 [Daphnia pulex]
MEYQKEELFFAYITGDFDDNLIIKPVIHFACAKHRRFGLKVEDIYCSWQKHKKWYKMEPKKSKINSELLLRFTVQLDFDIITNSNRYPELIFDIRSVSTIGNYYYKMMDDYLWKNLWAAATNQKLTDVEIFVGTVKVIDAHRIILCARSSVLNMVLNKISNTEKSIFTFGEEFDVDIVHYFLKFLYTGHLKTSAKVKQMSQLADM